MRPLFESSANYGLFNELPTGAVASRSIINRDLKVRIEVENTNSVARVFINGIFISGTSLGDDKTTGWDYFNTSKQGGGDAFAFYVGKMVEASVDNLVIKPMSYPTVTFVADGGSFSGANRMMIQRTGRLDAFPVVVKNGFVVEGWYTEDGRQADRSTTFYKDTTLTAQWKAVEPDSGDGSTTSGPNLWLAVLLMRYNRQYEITAEAVEGGTITPEGVTKVKYNCSQAYEIKANEGYEPTDVLVDGKSVGKVDSYEFKKVQKAHTISAVFSRLTVEVSAEAGEGGTITPAGKETVNWGESKTYTIKADEGFEIADVLVDGKSVGKVESYTFEKLTAASSISAFFAKLSEEQPADPTPADPTPVDPTPVDPVPANGYTESFDSIDASLKEDALLEKLGWFKTKNEAGEDCTAAFSIEDGRLIMDNTADDSKNVHVVAVPTALSEEISKDDYVVEYDMTFLDGTKDYVLLGLLFNYNSQTNDQFSIMYIRSKFSSSKKNAFQHR